MPLSEFRLCQLACPVSSVPFDNSDEELFEEVVQSLFASGFDTIELDPPALNLLDPYPNLLPGSELRRGPICPRLRIRGILCWASTIAILQGVVVAQNVRAFLVSQLNCPFLAILGLLSLA